MNTLEFLRAILPEDGIHYLAIFKPGFVAPAHKAFSSLESMADAIAKMDAGEWTVYHACASYNEEFIEVNGKKKYRVSDNWKTAKAFWVDIDCGEDKAAEGKGYLTKKDAAVAMKQFCETTGLPVPFYVDSGNGIHAYWPLTQPIKADTWVKMASVLKAALAHHGVLADPTRTADFASILRPVGSHNKKTDDFKPVKAANQVKFFDPKEIASILKTVSQSLPKQPVVQDKKHDINDDLTAHLQPTVHMESSAQVIASKCKQMEIVRDTRGDVDYEHWRGAIGVIKFCVEGRDLAHEWSQGYAGYTEAETDAKIESWGTAPATCDFFVKCNPSACTDCPHRGKIKTPMVLGRVMPEPKEEVVEATVEDKVVQIEVPAFPEGFKWDGQQMLRIMEDKDGNLHPTPFSTSLFYPTARIRKEDGQSGLSMRVHMPPPFNSIKEFELDTWLAESPQKLSEALGRYDVYTTNNKGSKDHMSAYLKASIEKLKREAEELNTMTAFGWKDNLQSFLIGDRLYHHDGTVRKVLVGGNARAKITAFPQPRGTAEKYAEALNFMYARPKMVPMQYAIASGFGSILTPLGPTMYKGLMLAITGGATAKGKTSVCLAAMYAFGDADKMKIGTEKGSTINARSAMLSTYQNIPLLFDEFTKIAPEEFSALAYMVSQGMDKDRMTQTSAGTRAVEQAVWQLSPYVTANSDLHGLLAQEKGNSEAEAVRVIQIRIDQYSIDQVSIAEADAAMKQMELNMGSAGDKFLRYIVANREDVLHRMAEIGAKLEKHIPDVKYRFYRMHAMCSLAAISITNELGITKFDMNALFEYVVSLFKDLSDVIQAQNTMTEEDALSSMITDLSGRFIVSHDYRHARDALGPESVQYRGSGAGVAGRYILFNKNKPSDLGGKLFIAHKEAAEWCRKHQMELKNIIKWGKQERLITIPNDKFSLGKGTTVKTGNTTVICVDMVKLEEQSPNGLINLVSTNSAEAQHEERTGT